VEGRDDDPIYRNVSVKVARPYLTVAGVDEDDEMSIGAFVPLNNDSDNPEDDLVSFTVVLAPDLDCGELKLDATAGEDKIKVWTTATKETEVSLPETWDVGEDQLPTQPLWVEGISGSALRGVELPLSYTHDEEMLSDDKAKITVWDFVIA